MANVLELQTKVSVTGADKLGDVSKKLGDVGRGLTTGVTVPLVALGGSMIALSAQADTANAKLSSAFESMGAATWTSVDALKASAQELDAMSSAFDVNAITEAQSVMLTFGNVTGSVFTDANRLVVDMAEALGTDLQGASIQVGKALNDPVAGVSALSEVGVSFTQDQKDMIAAMVEGGDVAGAQAIIMGELTRQFGGTAQAIADTPMGEATNAMQDLKEAGGELGGVLAETVVPALTGVVEWVKGLVERFQSLSPETQDMIIKVGLVAAAIGPLLLVGSKLVTAFSTISKGFQAMSLVFTANPFVLLIGAIVALVALVVLNWDKIKAAIGAAWDWVMDRTEGFRTALVDFFTNLPGKLAAGLKVVGDAITAPFKTAFNAVSGLWNRTIGKLHFTIPDWVPGIGGKGFDMPKMPTLARGGIVTAPTIALVGEAGPEAVIPLDRLGGRPTVVNINVPSGAFLDPVEAGRQIAAAVRSYERAGGRVA